MKLVLIIITAALLSSCGIKPADLKAPKDYQGKEFPQTYPER